MYNLRAHHFVFLFFPVVLLHDKVNKVLMPLMPPGDRNYANKATIIIKVENAYNGVHTLEKNITVRFQVQQF